MPGPPTPRPGPCRPAPTAVPTRLSPQKFDELLHLASRGQHANVDMLVQDIYGGAHQTLGLSGNLIASSFGKSATADRGTVPSRHARPLACPPARRRGCSCRPAAAGPSPVSPPEFSQEDMAKSLLHMISNDIGQLACLYAKLHGLDRVYFGGFFTRGHPVTMRTITYSINFFSKVTGVLLRPGTPARALGAKASPPWDEGCGGGRVSRWAPSPGLRPPSSEGPVFCAAAHGSV